MLKIYKVLTNLFVYSTLSVYLILNTPECTI